MIRAPWLGVVAIVLACRFARGDDAPKFKKLILPDAVRFSQLFSPDQHVGTMLFDNLVIATEIGRAALPSVATKKFTYVVFPESTQDVCVKTTMRGFVWNQGSGSASLVIHAQGKSTLVDLDKAIANAKAGSKIAKSENHQLALKAARDQGMKIDRATQPLGDEFLQTLDIRVPAGKPLQVTCNLLVDRLVGDDGSGSMLAIDSIDFEVTPVDPAKK